VIRHTYNNYGKYIIKIIRVTKHNDTIIIIYHNFGHWKLRTYYKEYCTAVLSIEVMSYKHTRTSTYSLMVTNHHRDRVDLLVISYNL